MKKFTLVEALIIIAIIGIIISILLPSITKAKEKGRQAICLFNFKQMNTGTFRYVKENRQKVFRAINLAEIKHIYNLYKLSGWRTRSLQGICKSPIYK